TAAEPGQASTQLPASPGLTSLPLEIRQPPGETSSISAFAVMLASERARLRNAPASSRPLTPLSAGGAAAAASDGRYLGLNCPGTPMALNDKPPAGIGGLTLLASAFLALGPRAVKVPIPQWLLPEGGAMVFTVCVPVLCVGMSIKGMVLAALMVMLFDGN